MPTDTPVLVADGALGTMLQQAGLTAADYRGTDGCLEVINLSRPDLVQSIHRAYLAVGVDAVTTNSFGAHPLTLAEHGLAGQTDQLNRLAAQLARQAVDQAASPSSAALVLGSMGPGSKLPSLGHVSFAEMRDGYALQAAGLLGGGADRLLIETCQDPLQAKAAVLGARLADPGAHLTVHLTIETTGTMLMGTETLAALTTLEALGVDGIGLNCATGPEEMSEHLRTLAQNTALPISAMPNAGLPVIGPDGQAVYDLTPQQLATWLDRFVDQFGLAMVGGCCGTTPEHLAAVVTRLAARARRPAGGDGAGPSRASGIGRASPSPHLSAEREVWPTAGRLVTEREPAGRISSLFQAVDLKQDTSYLVVGERTNANGSKRFRQAMVAGDTDTCLAIARDQAVAGAHILDLSVDYVGRDGPADMARLVRALATTSTLPLMIDTTEPAVVKAALDNYGGRAVVNSVNYESGDGADSRFRQTMALVKAHGAAVVGLAIDEQGQARTAERKLAVAQRLVDQLSGEYGLAPSDILIDPLTFPIGTGQDETRRDGLATLEAVKAIRAASPKVGLMLGVSNVSFGLSPQARVVLNSVFLDQAVKAGLDAAIVRPGGIKPLARLEPELVELALDLLYDRRRPGYDPLLELLERCQDLDLSPSGPVLETLPLAERIAQRIIDGAADGLEADLAEALAAGQAPLDLINELLLGAMAQVGVLFGEGRMQLPFVLRSAEVMKQAVAYLEGRIEASSVGSKGTVVLATVAGDVHDIGKNLVDIIVSNNGFKVVNLGVKQPIGRILAAAEESGALAIGLSGLLVKSTQVMKANLEEMNLRGVAGRWPVVLGGAALTRSFVETELRQVFEGEVYYAKDAFTTLDYFNQFAGRVAAGTDGSAEPAKAASGGQTVAGQPRHAKPLTRDEVAAGTDESAESAKAPLGGKGGRVGPAAVPTPPFWGTKVTKGIALAAYVDRIDPRSLFVRQWGLKAGAGERSVEELIETEGWPRYRALIDEVRAKAVAQAGVIHGYFPVRAEAETLILFEPTDHDSELGRLTFPRQANRRHLCLTDYFARDRLDVLALQAVTVGAGFTKLGQDWRAKGRYRDYAELNGLAAELTEALAAYWHDRIRLELGLEENQGARYSLGYPACPDVSGRLLLCQILGVSRIGLKLTCGYQLDPAHATEAMVVHHREASYFSVRPTKEA
ncbi:MAG: homocysteine S-methyltransferase family protein [Micrococcales bacterium]|nr:homocysteine S-methyltransferase family protein [Micrococcales bacterium]